MRMATYLSLVLLMTTGFAWGSASGDDSDGTEDSHTAAPGTPPSEIEIFQFSDEVFEFSDDEDFYRRPSEGARRQYSRDKLLQIREGMPANPVDPVLADAIARLGIGGASLQDDIRDQPNPGTRRGGRGRSQWGFPRSEGNAAFDREDRAQKAARLSPPISRPGTARFGGRGPAVRAAVPVPASSQATEAGPGARSAPIPVVYGFAISEDGQNNKKKKKKKLE